MSSAIDSKTAAAYLDPMGAPEPSQETGLNTHFGSTFAPKPQKTTTSPRTSLSSNNPFREPAAPNTPPSGARQSSSSPRERFPNYRADAFGDYAEQAPRSRSGSNTHPPPPYNDATASAHGHRRRTSSLRERFPGDQTVSPLNMIRKDSKKAARSPHLKKRHQPGADTIDRLDPAIGGRAYHHEGPFDAALLARNTSFENAPIAALQSSNEEALKATPQENIIDAVERHMPLDGTAVVPPGVPDRFGRTYDYQEGADLMHEDNNDGPGYKRWADKDYHEDDLKGQSEPTFSLDQALRGHKISDNGIEMQDGNRLNHGFDAAKRNGRFDERDPVDIAGGESQYVDMELANTHDSDAKVQRGNSLRANLKKRIGSLRKKNQDD